MNLRFSFGVANDPKGDTFISTVEIRQQSQKVSCQHFLILFLFGFIQMQINKPEKGNRDQPQINNRIENKELPRSHHKTGNKSETKQKQPNLLPYGHFLKNSSFDHLGGKGRNAGAGQECHKENVRDETGRIFEVKVREFE